MRGLIKFFLDNTVAANLLMVFLFIMGFFGLMQMTTTFFPEAPNKLVNIRLIYPGASPEEMEEGVVSKIEENLTGIKGLDKSSSVSSENSASILVECLEGVNIDEFLQDIKNAVDQISSFPAAMEPPVIYKAEQIRPAYEFALSGDVDLKTLKRFARDIEDDLIAIDGISKVELLGFPEEEIEISFREKDMRSLNITFNEAVTAIAQTNLLATGGTIKTESEDLLIRAKNKNYYANEFRDIVLRSNPNGGVIRLSQIATVKDRWEDNPSRNFVNGIPSVSIDVNSTYDEDMVNVSELTIAYLEKFKEKNPEIKVTEIRDGKLYLNQRISFIKWNGGIGFLLVFVLLSMFLNIRIAFWVALAIPISFAGMFLCVSMLGITINIITTFGMIVVIGILVDDGIVIAENIYQHYERGASPEEAALEGTMEVLPAVSAAIITTVIAFATFFFVAGRLGDFFAQLAAVVIFALIFSLVEGALILPAHIAHSKALREGNTNRITRFFDSIMEFFKNKMYGPVIKFSMKFPLPTIAICITGLLVIVGALRGGLIKGTFFPNVQRDDFTFSLELPAGASEDRVYAILDSVESAAWTVNAEFKEKHFGGEKNVIDKIIKKVGPSTHKGSLTFYLLSGEERTHVENPMIIGAIRNRVGKVEDAEKMVFGRNSFFGDPVSISLLGKDPAALNDAIDELKLELKNMEDLRDVDDNNVVGLKEVAVALKPKAYNLGLTLGQIMQYIRQGFFGAEIQRLQRGSDEVKVWIRYSEDDRSSVADLANMRFRTPNGQSIPMGELVDFNTERGIISINHLNGQREIRVTADVANSKVSVSDVNNDIDTEILPRILDKYPSVKMSFEGQAKENARSQNSMMRVFPIILLCMLFVIILTFSSVSQAFIVYALFPFGFIGVGLGHWLLGIPISFLSILGIIALIGIIVNDALVFISTFNVKIKEAGTEHLRLMETALDLKSDLELLKLRNLDEFQDKFPDEFQKDFPDGIPEENQDESYAFDEFQDDNEGDNWEETQEDFVTKKIRLEEELSMIANEDQELMNEKSFEKLLYETGISRFRPIALTTITTVAGLLPLLLEDSVQAQFLIPMAVSIAFGLMVATFILLALIPSLMVVSNDIKFATTRLWTGDNTITRRMVEPAYPGRKHPWVLTLVLSLLALVGIAGLVYLTLQISQLFA